MSARFPTIGKWTICDLKMWELDEWPEVIRCQHHESDSDFRFYYPERTCRNDALKSDQFVCAECRKWYDIVDIEDDDWGGVPNYCPNCGAKVVKQ